MKEKKVHQKIAVMDFGGQYAHLIANRIRRLKVYSEIVSNNSNPESLKEYCGIILSGSPFSSLDENGPRFLPEILELGKPILGLCYGHQLLMMYFGGKVERGKIREYGRAFLTCDTSSPLFKSINEKTIVWMSHGDTVSFVPPPFKIIGSTEDCYAAAVSDEKRKIYGLQFHPEVTDTREGMKILDNFLTICGCKRDWDSSAFLEEIKEKILDGCGNRNAFLLVSGGVDSTVAFTLLNSILGPDRVMGLHIDNGLMRKRESETVLDYMKKHGFHNLKIIDASKSFLEALEGVVDPEKKREIIGRMFLKVKEETVIRLNLNPKEWILAQGTIYPDTIESAGTEHADKIKTHHNRIDPIVEMIEKGLVIEPLSHLYKDEVRELGKMLDLPNELLYRHPFPGPGLGVRLLCSDSTISKEFHNPEHQNRLNKIASEYGYRITILPVQSVGVQGDERSYAHPALVEGVLDWEILENLSIKITNLIPSVNRVVFKLTNRANSSEYKLIKAYITKDRLELLREVDDIATNTLLKTGEYYKVWQMPVVLLPLADSQERSCIVLRPVYSQEAMTARFAPLSKETLDLIIEGISRVNGIGDIFFDITHKPPATIEWE
ncbi:MAG: glutamine-hydrolyzing GMP synthase [Chitinispirillaceae bacterium]|nr:glutamine-hydrolyzing GMP synthase [Chitinispirillaceae bacterium]